MRDTSRPNLGTLMVPTTEKLWMFGLWKWRIIYIPPRFGRGARSILLERLCCNMVENTETREREEPWLPLGVL
jgi:hypothetical protein